MKINQTEIAHKSGIHISHVSNILRGVRRPSWKYAKALAGATHTSPYLWMEGTPEEIRRVLLETNT